MAGWSSLILCTLGFVALALAMPRHHEQLFRGKASFRWQSACRLLALLLLGLSLALAGTAWDNAVIAASAWLGMATLAAFAVAMALALLSR